MAEERAEQNNNLQIDPKVGRFIEVLDAAQGIAQQRFGTSIDGLRQQGEPIEDNSRIQEVVAEAERIVGPEDEFIADWSVWQKTRQAGSHKMGFGNWRVERQALQRHHDYYMGLDHEGKLTEADRPQFDLAEQRETQGEVKSWTPEPKA